jgi:arylesterase / paraoxonase
MRRFWRIAGWVAVALVVAIFGLVLRTLNSAGAFVDVTPGFSGTCKAIAGVAGPEDIQIDRAANIAFVSSTDWRALATHPSTQDGIYVLSLIHPESGFTRLAGTPANFHPRGLSLYRSARTGALTLMAVNHPHGAPSTIEIFDVTESAQAGGGVTLKHRSTVSGDLLFSPNDVVAVGSDRFYATNDRGSHTALGAAAETYLLLPRANVVYFNGKGLRMVADGMRFANGINVSPDLSKIYVAETMGRRLKTFGRDILSGDLTLLNTLEIPSGLDNIDVAANGDLTVAGHPKLLAFLGYAKDPSKPSPSQIFRVTVEGGIPTGAKAIYTDLGGQQASASVGATDGSTLLIGSVFDPQMLDCTMK